jgi:hypothetical protein
VPSQTWNSSVPGALNISDCQDCLPFEFKLEHFTCVKYMR